MWRGDFPPSLQAKPSPEAMIRVKYSTKARYDAEYVPFDTFLTVDDAACQRRDPLLRPSLVEMLS